jgi:23S rRNA (adenine2030-N6)-methyltransferase
MLSYLHGFHAGNHADVLKHVVLAALLARLTQKDKPLRYIDTHAGAGLYDLDSAAARKNHEYDTGIGKIRTERGAPTAVARLLDLVARANTGPALARYPGSPWLARELLRPEDQLFLFELHPTEHRALARSLEFDRRVKVLREDGLLGCVGLVPPPHKRALILIDPSYELKHEHSQVLDAVMKVHRRFATGTIAIWYPLVERRWVERFERALRGTGIAPVALYELAIAPEGRERGLIGSGMFVVNPPWPLHEELDAAVAWLAPRLACDGEARYRSAEKLG